MSEIQIDEIQMDEIERFREKLEEMKRDNTEPDDATPLMKKIEEIYGYNHINEYGEHIIVTPFLTVHVPNRVSLRSTILEVYEKAFEIEEINEKVTILIPYNYYDRHWTLMAATLDKNGNLKSIYEIDSLYNGRQRFNDCWINVAAAAIDLVKGGFQKFIDGKNPEWDKYGGSYDYKLLSVDGIGHNLEEMEQRNVEIELSENSNYNKSKREHDAENKRILERVEYLFFMVLIGEASEEERAEFENEMNWILLDGEGNEYRKNDSTLRENLINMLKGLFNEIDLSDIELTDKLTDKEKIFINKFGIKGANSSKQDNIDQEQNNSNAKSSDQEGSDLEISDEEYLEVNDQLSDEDLEGTVKYLSENDYSDQDDIDQEGSDLEYLSENDYSEGFDDSQNNSDNDENLNEELTERERDYQYLDSILSSIDGMEEDLAEDIRLNVELAEREGYLEETADMTNEEKLRFRRRTAIEEVKKMMCIS